MCIYNQLEYLFNPGEWSSQKREVNFFYTYWSLRSYMYMDIIWL